MSRRLRFSTVLTLLTLAVIAGLAGVCAAAPAPRSIEAELRAYTACFAQMLGVVPRWNLAVEMVRDSGEGRNNFGSALFNGAVLEARVVYNVYAIERDAYPTRVAALHEILHVATGELASYAFAYERDVALVESERLVRQMVRWPNWKNVCE